MWSKHVILRYTVAWLPAFIVLGILIALYRFGFVDLTVYVTLAGTGLSVVYFLQQQRLDEVRLFKELFTEFNSRYDKLNEKLGLIVANTNQVDLSAEDKQTLVDYFNLCSEEYLFYKQGYIPKEVWKAWLAGMQSYYKNERIRKLWNEDLGNSHYGFSAKELKG